VGAGSRRHLSYIIGYDTTSRLGGPQRLVKGAPPQSGEAVIDEVAADELHLTIGDNVNLLGRPFRISGLSSGGTSITNTTTFITTQDFAAIRGDALNYIMVKADADTSARALVERLRVALPNTTVQTRAEIIGQEGHIVRDMSADIMQMMTLIALFIALAVVALTLFTATIAKLREYAVVKALGATPARLFMGVMSQAAWTFALAFVTAIVLTFGISAMVSGLSPTVRIVPEVGSILRLAIGTIVIGVTGALIPLHRVLRLDPNSAFRRSS
jgi:putative ABC transport system permease protein